MTEPTTEETLEEQGVNEQNEPEEQLPCYYRVQFRPDEQIYSTESRIPQLKKGEVAMIQTDHGLEPAMIIGPGPFLALSPESNSVHVSYSLVRRANREETDKYNGLLVREKEAFDICQNFIAKHKLEMKLIKVERFFNGSKVIFYFTAENRVDFRELVKDLVQEFRTRVEIRQIGVRHETKMIGGIGCCGRELCCSSYIKKFAPVSIKMAKEQNLPLNPAKISGICNRLLCCLTYEYDTYHSIRKKMPKVGKTITLAGKQFKVLQQDILHEVITVADLDEPDKTITLGKAEWSGARLASPAQDEGRGSGRKKQKETRKKSASKKGGEE